jgi:hypothetical protein
VTFLPRGILCQSHDQGCTGRDPLSATGEIVAKYLDDMVASKRPGKNVHMNRNFRNAFANVFGKGYADQCSRT